ncbi:YceI family protein [Streptomyces sp. NPDC006458]|uniref:YceI family protein n=1 Tax=Streptomyces sp. NPDC006458 TaxID=3154302 RepID=UPI0033B02FA0
MDTTGHTVTTTPRLGDYTIDTDSSSISFRSRHLFGLLPVRGTFGLRVGTVEVTAPLDTSRIRVAIEAASFSTGHTRRDTDVRSARFLDTDRYPLITFIADRVLGTTVSGTLTVRGVSRPVRLTVVDSEVFADAFTLRAVTRVDRTDFGVTAARGLAGRRLDLTLEVCCVRAA